MQNRTRAIYYYPLQWFRDNLRGLDDADKLKSIYDIDSIWIEEASELSEGILTSWKYASAASPSTTSR
jgi:hypothetical protein